MSFKKPAIPTSMGRCADLFKDVQALRLAMAKEVEEVEAFEREIKQHIIDNLSKSDDTGAAGLRYRAQIVLKEAVRIAPGPDGTVAEGWQKFYGYVRQTGRFDLMQKRLSDKAVKDMLEAGEIVPGVETMKVPDVSITKL